MAPRPPAVGPPVWSPRRRPRTPRRGPGGQHEVDVADGDGGHQSIDDGPIGAVVAGRHSEGCRTRRAGPDWRSGGRPPPTCPRCRRSRRRARQNTSASRNTARSTGLSWSQHGEEPEPEGIGQHGGVVRPASDTRGSGSHGPTYASRRRRDAADVVEGDPGGDRGQPGLGSVHLLGPHRSANGARRPGPRPRRRRRCRASGRPGRPGEAAPVRRPRWVVPFRCSRDHGGGAGSAPSGQCSGRPPAGRGGSGQQTSRTDPVAGRGDSGNTDVRSRRAGRPRSRPSRFPYLFDAGRRRRL